MREVLRKLKRAEMEEMNVRAAVGEREPRHLARAGQVRRA
jgi:glycine betaine/choline ABC-type transport system substrate-binding protein